MFTGNETARERKGKIGVRKVLISVAPVAAIRQHLDAERLAAEVIACGEAGAAMVHLHVRDEEGQLTEDLTLVEKIAGYIRERSDIILQISTGGVSRLSIKQRCVPVRPEWVEANSLNVGSVNLGESVYQNPIQDVRYCVEQILKYKKVPEIEVFEMGMIKTVWDLAREYPLLRPILFSIVLGHSGAAPATERTLRSMLGTLEEFFPEPGETLWGITQAGREDFTLIKKALELGASTVRIGFEDSAYLAPGVKAESNVPLVERTAKLIRSLGLSPASPAEARQMLGMPELVRKMA